MTSSPDCHCDQDLIRLTGDYSRADVYALKAHGAIDRLEIAHSTPLKPKRASAFAKLASVGWLRLWCNVNRASLRYILPISDMKRLDILCLVGMGSIPSFSQAQYLEEFRGNFLTVADLTRIIECQTLRRLTAQNSDLSPDIISALRALPDLEALDLEWTGLTDDMLDQLSHCPKITTLEIGSNQISRTGLASIARMTQLQKLDVWGTDITVADLALLSALPHLTYLSVGGVEDVCSYDGKALIEVLSQMPALRELWLDGVPLTADQRATLEARYDKVMY